jgi:WD40 repeat protein
MQRISTDNKAVDLFGSGKHGFSGGDPSVAQDGTDLSADWCNGVQESLVRVIEAAGITPASPGYTQLLEALHTLFDVQLDGSSSSLAPSQLLAVGYFIPNAPYSGVYLSVTPQDNSPRDLVFKPDGTKLFVLGSQNDAIYEYALSIPFALDTATFTTSFSIASQETSAQGLAFNADGTKFYVVGAGGGTDTVFQYSLSSAYNMTTASYASVSFNGVNTQDTNIQSIAFNTVGTKMYILGETNNAVFQYTLATPFVVSSATYDGVNLNITSEDDVPTGMAFTPDGTKFFVVGSNTPAVYQYNLATAYNLSTAVYSGNSAFVGAQEITPQGVSFSADGSKMYVVGSSADAVLMYYASRIVIA